MREKYKDTSKWVRDVSYVWKFLRKVLSNLFWGVVTIPFILLFFWLKTFLWFQLVLFFVAALVLIAFIGVFIFYRQPVFTHGGNKVAAFCIRAVFGGGGSYLLYLLVVFSVPFFEDLPAYASHHTLHIIGHPAYIEKVYKAEYQNITIYNVHLRNFKRFIDPEKEGTNFFVITYLPHSHYVLSYTEYRTGGK